jgi:hypothetical protein
MGQNWTEYIAEAIREDEGIRNVLKECWAIYTADPTVQGNEGINWSHKLAALKLARVAGGYVQNSI